MVAKLLKYFHRHRMLGSFKSLYLLDGILCSLLLVSCRFHTCLFQRSPGFDASLEPSRLTSLDASIVAPELGSGDGGGEAVSPASLCQHLEQLNLLSLSAIPTVSTALVVGHAPRTAARYSSQLSPVLGGHSLGVFPDTGSAIRRRCSSPGAFLHIIREDGGSGDQWDDDEAAIAAVDFSSRKTSLGMDDGSPIRPDAGSWSRKTSSTSGYSEMTDGSGTSRKTSFASDERLSIYSNPSRKASGASEDERDQLERLLLGGGCQKTRHRSSADYGYFDDLSSQSEECVLSMVAYDSKVSFSGEAASGPTSRAEQVAACPPSTGVGQAPLFQLVIHNADGVDHQPSLPASP